MEKIRLQSIKQIEKLINESKIIKLKYEELISENNLIEKTVRTEK